MTEKIETFLNQLLIFPKKIPNVTLQISNLKLIHHINKDSIEMETPESPISLHSNLNDISFNSPSFSDGFTSPELNKSNRFSINSSDQLEIESTNLNNLTGFSFKLKRLGVGSRKLYVFSALNEVLNNELRIQLNKNLNQLKEQKSTQNKRRTRSQHVSHDIKAVQEAQDLEEIDFHILSDFYFIYNNKFIELERILPSTYFHSFEDDKNSGICWRATHETYFNIDNLISDPSFVEKHWDKGFKLPSMSIETSNQMDSLEPLNELKIIDKEDKTVTAVNQDEDLPMKNEEIPIKPDPNFDLNILPDKNIELETLVNFEEDDKEEKIVFNDQINDEADIEIKKISLQDSNKSVQGLLSSNNLKKLKRLQYLDDVFEKGKDTYLPEKVRDGLLHEYEKLMSESNDNWKEELKLAKNNEIKRVVDIRQPKNEWRPELEEEEEEEICGEEEEDEWSDASSVAASENSNIDEMDLEDDYRNQEPKGVTITMKDMAEEERKRKREEEESKPKRKGHKKKSKNELKREINKWNSVISIVAARYRVVLNTMISEDVHALLLSLKIFKKINTLTAAIKLINDSFDTVKTLKESIVIECSDEEFKLLILYSIIYFNNIGLYSRFVSRLDPRSYNQAYGTSNDSVVYIDCAPPTKKKREAEDPYPASNIKVEVHINGEWRSIQLSSKGVITTKKAVKPLREKHEFPIFYLGMTPEASFDLTNRFIRSIHAKDTGIIQSNFQMVTKWYKKNICPSSQINNIKDSIFQKLIEEESKKLEALTDVYLQEIPTSQGAFRFHPIYILDKFISRYYAIYPKDTPPVGMHGEHAIYKRSSLALLHTKDRWLQDYLLEVRPEEIDKPYKIVRSMISMKKGMTHLFGKWQTRPYIAPLAENGIVPKNERGIVDLWNPGMLPRGCVHLSNMPYVSSVCKKLKIDYAPCMTGFEIKHWRNVPKIDGVIICQEFENTIREAYVEYMQLRAERQEERRLTRIYDNWKKLIRGMLARQKATQLFDKFKDDNQENETKNVNNKMEDQLEGNQVVEDVEMVDVSEKNKKTKSKKTEKSKTKKRKSKS